MQSIRRKYCSLCAAAEVKPNSSLVQELKSLDDAIVAFSPAESSATSMGNSREITIDCRENILGPLGFSPFLQTLAAFVVLGNTTVTAAFRIRLHLLLCECNITNDNVTALAAVIGDANGNVNGRVQFVELDLRRNVHVSLSGGKALRRLAAQFRNSLRIFVDGCSINAALARAIGAPQDSPAPPRMSVSDDADRVVGFFDHQLESLSTLYRLVQDKPHLPHLDAVFGSAGFRTVAPT